MDRLATWLIPCLKVSYMITLDYLKIKIKYLHKTLDRIHTSAATVIDYAFEQLKSYNELEVRVC